MNDQHNVSVNASSESSADSAASAAESKSPNSKRPRWFQWSLRTMLALMFVSAIVFAWLARPRKQGPQRIYDHNDKVFAKAFARVNFDKSPAGLPVKAQDDVSRMYVPWGCVISTSMAKSYVAAQSYNVGGRSGGNCAANLNPLYQGVITIRFCKPGNENVAAGVTIVGFWTSHIAPDGTALEAYDGQGNRIHTIKTIKERKDFLAIQSDQPIAYIKIVPNLKIDMDYAIDDVVFDKPQLLNE